MTNFFAYRELQCEEVSVTNFKTIFLGEICQEKISTKKSTTCLTLTNFKFHRQKLLGPLLHKSFSRARSKQNPNLIAQERNPNGASRCPNPDCGLGGLSCLGRSEASVRAYHSARRFTFESRDCRDGWPRAGVVVEKFLPSSKVCFPWASQGGNLGCSRDFAGTSQTFGGVQKVCANQVCAHSHPESYPENLLRLCFAREAISIFGVILG